MDMQRTTYCPSAMSAELFNYVDHAIHAQQADHASLASSVAWANVTGKPATYPPSGHHTSHELGGSDVISLSGLRGVTVYMDHIAENTGGHTITLDNDVTASGNITLANNKDLLSGTGGGSDLGTPTNYFGAIYATTHYADHIAERTGSHNIFIDNEVRASASTLGIGSSTYPFGSVWAKYHSAYGTAANFSDIYFETRNVQAAAVGVGGSIYFRGGAGGSTMGQFTCAWEDGTGNLSYYAFYTRNTTPAERWRINSAGAWLANQNGAVSAPVVSWSADPDTGLYRIGTNDIGISAGNALVAEFVNTGAKFDHIAELTALHGIYFDNAVVFQATTYMANGIHFLPGTAGGSNLGSGTNYWGAVYTTSLYVDHIAERTGAHTIYIENNLTMAAAKDIIAGSTDCDIGTEAALFGNICGTNFYNAKIRITPEGGYAVKLTNKTGGNSVKGQIVIAASGTDNAFATAGADADMPIGIVYNAGIADGQECWVVIAGRCEILVDAGGASRGYVLYCGSTGGSATASAAVPAITNHMREVGHALTGVVGAGLVFAITHYN